MNSVLLTFHLLGFCSLAVSAVPIEPATKADNTLVLLHVLFRHGNRAADKSSLFPNDIHINDTYSPYGYSQLTLKGKQTEYKIGQYIRQHYGKFISEQYTPNVVYAVSTNLKRTKMSLELVLSGLFPPLTSDKIQNNVNWQPIPFNIEAGSGIITPASSGCPNYITQYFSYILTPAAQEIISGYQSLYNTLSRDAGFDVIIPRDAANIYFTLKSEEDFGLKVPEWTKGLWPETLEDAASVDYEFSTANPTLLKLSAGGLVKKILEDSLAQQNGTLSPERKVFLYSAHEYNVATTLRLFNVFYRHVPPFGATIYFEIHKIDGVYGLKLFYQDYKQNDPKLLTIPGCSSFCPLEQVYDLIGKNLPGPNDVCVSTTEVN